MVDTNKNFLFNCPMLKTFRCVVYEHRGKDLLVMRMREKTQGFICLRQSLQNVLFRKKKGFIRKKIFTIFKEKSKRQELFLLPDFDEKNPFS